MYQNLNFFFKDPLKVMMVKREKKINVFWTHLIVVIIINYLLLW